MAAADRWEVVVTSTIPIYRLQMPPLTAHAPGLSVVGRRLYHHHHHHPHPHLPHRIWEEEEEEEEQGILSKRMRSGHALKWVSVRLEPGKCSMQWVGM